MVEHSIFTSKEADFLTTLVDHDVDFMIVGLSAAILQGAPGVTQDIDLWVRDLGDSAFLQALREVDAVVVPQIGVNPPMLAGDRVRLFDLVLQMSGLGSFEDEFAYSIRIDVAGVAVRVLALDRIIVSKEAANREKDRRVLPMLRDAAIALGERRRSGSHGKKR